MASRKAAPAAASEKAKQLADRHFGLEQFKYQRWAAELDESTTLDDARDPRFWAGQASKMMGYDGRKGRGDIIVVRKPDSGLYAELLVTEVGPGFVRTVVVFEAEPEAVDLPAKCPLETRWSAGKGLHEVIRRADKHLMHPGFPTKVAAVTWIVAHLASLES